jgi:hypothetical protein
MVHEDDSAQKENPSQKWQALGAMGAVVFTVGCFLYQQSQISGANAVTVSNHTQEIAALQTSVNNEQVLLYSINAQLTGLTQKIDDMQQSRATH